MPTLRPARSAISPILPVTFFLESLPGRRRATKRDVVLPQDGQCLRVGRHVKVAATDCQVGFAGAQQGHGFGRSFRRDRGELDHPAFLFESLGHRLDHLMIVAACGSDGDPEGLGLHDVEQGGRSGAENNKSQSQHEQ